MQGNPVMSELLEDSPTTRIVYELRQGGIVGDWLVLGPLLLPALEPKSTYDAAARLQALRSQLALVEEITQVPSERSICTVTMGNDATQEAMWRVVNTLEDGRVDLAAQVATPHMMLAWGYAQIALPERITTTLYLDACGPIQVRIND